jgi:hypothetical protein
METIYVMPNWFFGVDIALELLFAILTLAIALYSFKIYKLSEQRELKFLGISFSFFSLSYLFWALNNLFLLSVLGDESRELSLKDIGFYNHIGIYLYLSALILGVVTLFYTTLKTESKRTYLMLVILTSTTFIFSLNRATSLYTVLAIFFLFIFAHYFRECRKTKNKLTKRNTLAMGLLFLGSIAFIYAPSYYSNYVIVHLLHGIAYSLLISSLVSVINKHGQKKK